MVDDPDVRTGADATHLDGCSDCKARFESISRDAGSISALLAVPDARLDMARAFSRVRSAPSAQPRLGFRLPIFSPAPRPLKLAFAAALATFALVVVAFASNGLWFSYHPTTVKPVPVTVADMQALSQLANYGTFSWTKQPNFQVATSAADASAAANGLAMPSAKNLPSNISTTVTYAGMSEATAVFTFSADKAAAAAASQGKTLPPLPAGMDGATLTVTVGPAVGVIYGDLKQTGTSPTDLNIPQLVIAKSAAPTAKATQVSLQQLEDYLLSLPGISSNLANAVKAIGDPSKTLLIPVPVEYASSTPVSINGSDGVALGDNTGIGAGVVWVGKDGYVYVVVGAIKQTDAVTIAKTL
jgi:hypothetical protein